MFVPKINDEKCKQCGECIDVCPADVLAANDSKTVVANAEDCLG
ncbi:MAG: 4Fe-4S binding protein, partial [Desulfomonilaceae bacterium]